MLSPKHKRFLKQLIPFVIIWFGFGLVYSFVELGLLGRLTHYPTTGNRYNFQANILVTTISCLVMGMVQGWIELGWLRKKLNRRTLWVKISLKTIFYLAFVILFLVTVTMLNSVVNSEESGLYRAFEDVQRFIGNFVFWSIIIYISAALFIALFFSEISQYLGDGVLFNFLMGKYHRPKTEIRIFMFLDMKSSTTIAENIGHVKYFDLLKAYYADMTNAILETSGEVYQYVGDEIVVAWTKKDGIHQNNCIRCLEKIFQAFEERKDWYLDRFGLVPEFKAGYHIGEVTTGEIGIIKKDIIYTGDVLNTTARIQAECNTYDAKALISGNLLEELQKEDPISFSKIGAFTLRGKMESIQLYSVVF